jgi:hypothetical protein
VVVDAFSRVDMVVMVVGGR